MRQVGGTVEHGIVADLAGAGVTGHAPTDEGAIAIAHREQGIVAAKALGNGAGFRQLQFTHGLVAVIADVAECVGSEGSRADCRAGEYVFTRRIARITEIDQHFHLLADLLGDRVAISIADRLAAPLQHQVVHPLQHIAHTAQHIVDLGQT